MLVDGKYVKVKKNDKKIPVIYGVDYKTHDIPHFRLTKSEDYLNCKKFFESIKLTSYPLQAIVCDDNKNIYNAARYVFPKVVIQLCHIHFLRNMKALLYLENNHYFKDIYYTKNTPTTTNLIESMNSHLEARLRPLKGFESFKHANLWLNGYFLRRRTRKWTDCSEKFRRLNGKTSLEITKKPGIDVPSFF